MILNDPTMPATRDMRISARPAALALGMVMVGMAIHLTDGLYAPPSLAIVVLAMLICGFAVLAPQRLIGTIRLRTFVIYLGLLLTLQLLAMLLRRAGASATTVPDADQHLLFYHLTMALTTIPVGMIALGRGRLIAAGFVLLLASYLAIGIWKIQTARFPMIDVFVFHHDAATAIERGHNPYAITFPDIYGPDVRVYGAGVVADGRLQFGYPYPPLVLDFTAASDLLLGDSRYAQLIATFIAALLIAATCRGPVGMLVAGLLLFTSRSFYVLEMSWTEPISVMFLAATIFAGVRAPRWTGLFLGLLFASKQYLPMMVVLVPLLAWRADGIPGRTFVARMGYLLATGFIAAMIVTLPLALWDWHAFWNSVVALQFRQPFRGDALSLLAIWGSGVRDWNPPGWLAALAFVAFALAAVACLVRAERNLAGFAGSVAFCFLAFLVVNKQAFANYYYFAIAALACAVCAAANEESSTSFSAAPEQRVPAML